MKTAKEIMTTADAVQIKEASREIDGGMPLVDVLPLLLDSPDGRLGVRDGGRHIGEIDGLSMLRGLGSLISPRDDSSVVTLLCSPGDYSASRIAMAVEDTDTHLVDLWTSPAESGMVEVNLRVRRDDPSAVVHSLERYGYEVVSACGRSYRDAETTALRILELNTLLSV